MLSLFKKLRPFLLIMMLLFVGIGFYSFETMPKESSPDINIPFFSIIATYPWSDSKSVEKQVTQKIEDKLNSVDNLSTYKSSSTDNVSVLTVQFKRWTDKNTAYSDLKSALDEVKTKLPSNTQITLKKTDLINLPVYTFSIAWNLYPSVLYDKLRFLEDDLKRIPWVDHVDIIWKYIPKIQIKFNYEKLKKYNLSISQIVWLLHNFIDDKSLDKKEINWILYSFKASSYSLENCKWNLTQKAVCVKNQIKEIPLINKNWSVLRLKDIANVQVWPWFYKKESFIDGKTAITYMVYKVPWTDMIKLVSQIKNYLQSKNNFFKQNNLTFKEVSSRVEEVNKTYNTFINNFRQTSLIILIVITLFIWLKEAFGIFLAFPLVYLISFIFLNAIWYTFNNIVSFSLILTLWIMVDNLIVIIEGFEEGIKKWFDKYQAIAYSVKTYFKPILAWNFTTVAMFLPLSFMLSGRIGEFMKYLPTTVNSVLIIAMIVSFVFLPLLLTYLYKNNFKLPSWWNIKDNFIYRNFKKLVKIVLHNPKKVIFIFWILFTIVLFAFIKFWQNDFLPATDKNNIYVNVKYENDVNLQENKVYTARIYSYVKEFFKDKKDIVKSIQIKVWDYQTVAPLDRAFYSNAFNPNLATFNITLIDTDKRPEKYNAVKLYPKLNDFLQSKLWNFNWKIKEISAFVRKNWPSSGKDVWFYIATKNWTWDDIEILAKEYEKLLPKLKKIPWTYAWSSSLEYGNWKIQILYDLDKIKQLNLNISDLNSFLLSFYSKKWDYRWQSLWISSLSNLWKDIVPVQSYIEFSWKNLDFNSMIIPWTNIYFSQVIKKIVLNPDVRYYKHLDWKPVLNISAYKTPDTLLWPITTKIQQIVSKDKNIQIYYASDIKDMKKSWKDLGIAFMVGIFLMFAVLVLNFWNYSYPLIIFSIIPLLFIGAFALLLIFDIPFGFAAQLGMFGLIWVWVNDAILLIERYEELKKTWEDKDEILIKTVVSRLKPVFLTSLTTVLWLATLAVKDALWWSLALSFMWGLIIWTLIILLYIPAVLKIKKK